MVSSRKRALRDAEADEDAPQPSRESAFLQRIRNCWQFANLFQWIYLFGKVVKIDESIDIDDLEAECLKPHSAVLVDIGLALLKFVSSHRGLTPELFDEYTRRQYVAKAPEQNPFGTDEIPAKFDDFDALLKIRVLQQLSRWVMLHPDRIREKMDEQKPSDQTEWRIEPTGWDSDDRTYYILDDNRLYRMTPAAPAAAHWKPKKNTKKAKAAARAAKRRRTSRSTAHISDHIDEDSASGAEGAPEMEDDGLGGAKWECLGVGLGDIQNFLASLKKTRDENEMILRDAVEAHLLPILEKQEESRKRKALQRAKELLNLEKMAHAKRSSRIANKAERQKEQEQSKEEEERRRKEEATAKKEQHKRLKMEQERDNRMMSREQRLKEREARRIQHEEELAQLSEDSKNLATGNGRLSERRLKAEIEKNKQALQELEEEEEDWIFDCVCGVYGQVDDGTHSIACEKCNVWQHSKCAGISEEEADRDDFHFICKPCQRKPSGRLESTKQSVIKLKLRGPDSSASTPDTDRTDSPIQQDELPPPTDIVVELPSSTQRAPRTSESFPKPIPGPILSGQPIIPVKQAGQLNVLPPPSPHANGDNNSHAFSSPHPTLSPPQQSPNKSRAYSTLFNASSPVAENHASGDTRLPQKGVFHVSPQTNGVVSALTARASNSTALSPSTAPALAASVSQNPFPEPSPYNNTSLSTPQLNKSRPLQMDSTPTLPPSRNGISPQKRSPPPTHHSSNSIHSSPTPAILPPVTALPPSPPQPILTPPVKPSEPVRPASQQSNRITGDA
ncbi:hypothetical protein GGR56DRAFT_42821 [Xylariaceae sp. FL0804]|nr:hypothetical protein GGR56DRAFT_42821 [Xylariaceae sp. FL0804]